MPTLYEIQDDLRALDDALADCGGEITEDNAELFAEWFRRVESDLSGKVECYIHLIRELDARSAAMAAEAEEFAAKARIEANKSKALKNRLLEFMDGRRMDKIKTNHFTVSVSQNGSKLPLKITDESKVPKAYTYKPPAKIDTEKIRLALMEGKKLAFATLGERGKHLRIR